MGAILRRRAALGLTCGAMASLLACAGHGTEPAPRKADPSLESARATSRPRLGANAHVVWKAKERGQPQGMCSRTYDIFEVIEIRSDETALYLDLFHQSANPEKEHTEAVPKVDLLVDGCPVRQAPTASGAVLRDSETPTTTVLPLSDLPDGDLDLILHAFGSEYVVVLHKNGRQVKRITRKDRKGAQLVPADEKLGIPEAVVVPQQACPEEVEL
jgi:hypothetical protein